MPVQDLPRSAARYARAQRTEIAAAVAAVSRAWRGMGSEFDASWAQVAPTLVAVVETAQGRVAAGAAEYVPAVLAETGQDGAVEPFASVRPSGLVGVAGDGRPVDTLLYGAVVRAREGAAGGLTAPAALRGTGKWLNLAVGTVLSDTGRQSESLAMGVRPVTGYVRMLNPPSCSRCVVLAGKWYRKNAGFPRHPGCDCRHIPASESAGGDLTVDPVAYFDSLSPAEQDATFTKAGAEAIRSGANLGQVVNARRGVAKAQAGRPKPGARLMPERISQVARDRSDYLRLLGENGYLGCFPAAQGVGVNLPQGENMSTDTTATDAALAAMLNPDDPADDAPEVDAPDDGDVEGNDDGADELGDKGKQALDRMKAKLRAERERRIAAEAKAAEASDKDETARISREAEARATAKANARIVKAEVRAAAAGKLADPADALAFLNVNDFEVDEDGDVDADEISAAIDDLIRRKPHLAAQGGAKTPKPDRSQGAVSTGSASTADQFAAVIRKAL